MTGYRLEPPIHVGGRTIEVLALVGTHAFRSGHAVYFSGWKEPVAVICRSAGGVEIRSLGKTPISDAAQRTLAEAKDSSSH